ncbi:MAG: hypothetical protein Q9175_007623 [Cornicularia normoerica]
MEKEQQGSDICKTNFQKSEHTTKETKNTLQRDIRKVTKILPISPPARQRLDQRTRSDSMQAGLDDNALQQSHAAGTRHNPSSPHVPAFKQLAHIRPQYIFDLGDL